MFDAEFFNNLLGRGIIIYLQRDFAIGAVVVATLDNFVVFNTGHRVLISEITAVNIGA